MHRSDTSKWRARTFLCPSMFVALVLSLGTLAQAQTDPDKAVDKIPTASPIKRVIIIVGENRSFDHLFATYEPKNRDEKVLNLLSERIINADGTPGPNFAKGHQFQIVAPPNGGKFFMSADLVQKQLYAVLPAPDLEGVGAPPNAGVIDPGLAPADEFLLNTGGTGLNVTLGPDVRISNFNNRRRGHSN